MVAAILPGSDRPDPPPDLPTDEAAEWRSVVERMPDRFFGPQTHKLLRLYCAISCAAEFAVRKVRRLQAEPVTDESRKELDRQVKIADRLAARAANLASKLRIAPQPGKHQFTAEAEIRKAPTVKPWLD